MRPANRGPVRQAKAGGERVARSEGFEWLARSRFAARGVIYVLVGVLALDLALGHGGQSASQQGALRMISHQPFGQVLLIIVGVFGWPLGAWLVGIVGAVFIGVGLYQGYRAFTKDFLEEAKTEQMSPRVQAWIKWSGVFGHLARMVVLSLVGAFLIKAAVEYDPSNAVGLDGALARLEHASYGPYLLGVVAAGLIAFGVYSLSSARDGRV
jgi:hypothetical protein